MCAFGKHRLAHVLVRVAAFGGRDDLPHEHAAEALQDHSIQRLGQEIRNVALSGNVVKFHNVPLHVVTHKVVTQFNVFGSGRAARIVNDGDRCLVVNVDRDLGRWKSCDPLARR